MISILLHLFPTRSGSSSSRCFCYSWEVIRSEVLMRYTEVHREILEPIHYMRYIFSLQAHLNRIYQVWTSRGTEMYWSSVYDTLSEMTKHPTEIKTSFVENFPAAFWKAQEMISSGFMKLVWLLHDFQIWPEKRQWSCDRKQVELVSQDLIKLLLNIVIKMETPFLCRFYLIISNLPSQHEVCLDSSQRRLSVTSIIL